MNKRQYKKIVKRKAKELAKLTVKQVNEIIEEFERGLICGLEKAMKKVEDSND